MTNEESVQPPLHPTRRKLNEAKFFLAHLTARSVHQGTELFRSSIELEAFGYYLSAFVSAARSVTWIMRKEYCHVAGWEAWFASRNVSDGDRILMTRFNDVRVRSEKVAPLEPHWAVCLDYHDPVSDQGGELVPPSRRITIKPVLDENASPEDDFEIHAILKQVGWALDDFEEEQLLDVCARYCVLLDSVVGECEAAFGVPMA